MPIFIQARHHLRFFLRHNVEIRKKRAQGSTIKGYGKDSIVNAHINHVIIFYCFVGFGRRVCKLVGDYYYANSFYCTIYSNWMGLFAKGILPARSVRDVSSRLVEHGLYWMRKRYSSTISSIAPWMSESRLSARDWRIAPLGRPAWCYWAHRCRELQTPRTEKLQ